MVQNSGMNSVVIAHFDPNHRLEDNFRLLLLCLEKVFDIVVLVTTSELPETETAQFGKLITIRRPNIGYDFYSYRVGLSYLYNHTEVGNILLVNSSFVIVDVITFTRMLGNLLRLSSKYDVVGITESHQIDWHLQSYLFLLGNKVLQSRWLRTFFEKVQPRDSKLEIILNYEIGFSRALIANNVKALALFKPSARKRLIAQVSWMKVIARNSGWLTGNPFRLRHEINWVHFGAEDIAKQFGFVKTEVLRTNPHGISTDFVTQLSNSAVLGTIQNLLDNSRSHYMAGKNGLTTLASNHNFRMVTCGRARVKGVRVAVVLHLYYFDQLNEICKYIDGIVEPCDLYVTTPFESDVHKIINRTSNIVQSVSVCLSENRGRDIRPFILLYRSGLLDGYIAVLKIHTKKSIYSSRGMEWRKQIFYSIMGDSLTIRRTIKLIEEGDVGIVGPHQFYLSHDRFWGANYENVKNLLIQIKHLQPNHEPTLGFFAGSMFWFAPKALRCLKDLPEKSLDFEPECGKQDGTLAHAIERIFCSIVKAAGYKVTSVFLAGTDISEKDTQGNRVPVL
jgi:lipopolysaccharide biosynthesis protein